jgi:hypothetical protein
VGQRLDALDVDLRPDFPGLAKVVAVKGAQRADGLVEGGGRQFALGLEVNQEVEDLSRIEIRE